MKKILIGFIYFYRRNISPVGAPKCRFEPTCSRYALQALEKYGALKGCAMAAGRLLRCHPFHRKGYKVYDPVP